MSRKNRNRKKKNNLQGNVNTNTQQNDNKVLEEYDDIPIVDKINGKIDSVEEDIVSNNGVERWVQNGRVYEYYDEDNDVGATTMLNDTSEFIDDDEEEIDIETGEIRPRNKIKKKSERVGRKLSNPDEDDNVEEAKEDKEKSVTEKIKGDDEEMRISTPMRNKKVKMGLLIAAIAVCVAIVLLVIWYIGVMQSAELIAGEFGGNRETIEITNDEGETVSVRGADMTVNLNAMDEINNENASAYTATLNKAFGDKSFPSDTVGVYFTGVYVAQDDGGTGYDALFMMYNTTDHEIHDIQGKIYMSSPDGAIYNGEELTFTSDVSIPEMSAHLFYMAIPEETQEILTEGVKGSYDIRLEDISFLNGGTTKVGEDGGSES